MRFGFTVSITDYGTSVPADSLDFSHISVDGLPVLKSIPKLSSARESLLTMAPVSLLERLPESMMIVLSIRESLSEELLRPFAVNDILLLKKALLPALALKYWDQSSSEKALELAQMPSLLEKSPQDAPQLGFLHESSPLNRTPKPMKNVTLPPTALMKSPLVMILLKLSPKKSPNLKKKFKISNMVINPMTNAGKEFRKP